MSFFEKLKTAVLGNPVFKEYELGKHVCSAGPGLLWRVHDGVKKTTRQEVSLFIFFKKVPTFEKLPKKERNAILEMLKKGPTQLVKLRHPQLLRVEHALVESGDCIVFVTEPVFCSLANVLGNYENLPSPLPLSIKEHNFHPVEIKYGLLQLAEGLSFLHNDARLFHGNLTPENVIINHKGEWKLGGFHFCCYAQYTSSAQTSFQFREYSTGKPLHTQPNLDYLAPEYILEKNCTTQSDMYSMGMLIYAIYNQGRAIFENRNNLLSYKSNVEQVSRVTNTMLGGVPEEIKDSVRAMLSMEPAVRIESLQMTKATFFDDPLITALHTLDGLCKQADIVKSQFYKTLHQTITQLPRRIVIQKVFPVLAAEFQNHIMIPFVLPNVLLIAEESSIQEFSTLMLPALRPVFTIQNPIQVPLILLHRMDLLLKKSSPSEVKEHLLPMIIGSLNSTDHDVQELCITVLPTFAASIDYTTFKHSIIPLIMSLCINTPYLSVKVKSLVSIGSMMDILDKHIILNQIMPCIYGMDDAQPGVLMAILGICHGALQRQKLGFDKDYLATKVLPFLIPQSTKPTLNVSQFNKFMMIIKDMLTKIQADHREYLEQNEKMQEQMRSTVQLSQDVKEAKKIADVTSGIEAMSNPNQEVSVPRRGATLCSLPSTGNENNSMTNAEVNWLSSISDVNVATPTLPQGNSSTPAASSLFAGLSVKDTISLSAATSNIVTASTSSSRSEIAKNTSNINTGVLLPQSVLISHHQPVATVSRAPLNTSYQPTISSASSTFQPQSTTRIAQSQPSSIARKPMLNSRPAQLASSTLLTAQPVMSSYNNTKPKQSDLSYQPPPIVPNTLAPATNMVSSTINEPPPPYPGDAYLSTSTSTSSVEVKTQPSLMASQKPAVNQQMIGSNHMSIRPPSNALLKPQQQNLLQITQPTNTRIGGTVNSNMNDLQVNHLTAFGPDVLRPQQSDMLMSTQSALKPQSARTVNSETSASNFTNLSISHALQMQGAPPGVAPIQSTSTSIIEPRGHTSATGVLFPQQPSVPFTTASIPYSGMNTGTATGLFQQPLIAAPPAVQPSQDSQYKMASGANPFSDINDLL